MASYIYGVWQGGLNPSYITYNQQNLAIGTHVGNYPHVVLALWNGSDYIFYNATYNLSYCADQTATYLATFGATYAATYYKEVACNVRALEWI